MKKAPFLLFALLLFACDLPAPQAQTPTAQGMGATSMPSPHKHTPTPSTTEIPTLPVLQTNAVQPATPTLSGSRLLPEESILILSPGPGSRVTHPVRVSGVAGPTQEQTLVVRVITADEQVLAIVSVQVEAGPGERGIFRAAVPISISEVIPALIQVYHASPRDGGLTHLSSVPVTLAPKGAANIKPVNTHLERIVIDQPRQGDTVQGGSVNVAGFGLASFEQTLIVEVIGPEGTLAGKQSVIVAASDLSRPGPFSADVLYRIAAPGPGRIVVRDPSAAFRGDVHITSVEINLEP